MKRKNEWITRVTAAVSLSAAVGMAMAQYTPGSGGYGQPTPMPQQPAQPGGQPSYSWDPQGQPQQPQPQPQYQQPQYGQPGYSQPPTELVQQPQPQQIVVPALNDQQLGDLTASIALYPDPLLAQMLPGATYVQELAYAGKWLEQHPGVDEGSLQQLPLSPTTKALMHYPSVLSIMTDHLDWTQSLGMAFTYQRGDVMAAVQRWRVRAVTAGSLYSCPQYQVLAQANTIMILPPPQQPVVYVPMYDPAVVYVRPVRPVRDMITFSAGNFSVRWLDNDVDWHDHDVRVPVHHDWDHKGNVWDDHRRGPDVVVIDQQVVNRPPPVVLHEPPPAPVRDRIIVQEAQPVVGVEVNINSGHNDRPRQPSRPAPAPTPAPAAVAAPHNDVVVTAPPPGKNTAPPAPAATAENETRTFTHDPVKRVAPVYPTKVVTPDKKVTLPPTVPTTGPAPDMRGIRGQ